MHQRKEMFRESLLGESLPACKVQTKCCDASFIKIVAIKIVTIKIVTKKIVTIKIVTIRIVTIKIVTIKCCIRAFNICKTKHGRVVRA